MFSFGLFFIILALVGFYWTLFGAATVAMIYKIASLDMDKEKNKSNENKKIIFDVLIAAHNEEVNLPHTLESLQELNLPKDKLVFKVFVGLDHCTDGTLSKLNDFILNKKLDLKYFENTGDRGKWFIIKQLIIKSDADWVALTDCGAIWNKEILIESVNRFYNENLICLAPSYLPDRAGFLEKSYWRMEQLLRTIENMSKGSIMVHGPTVFYKRSALLLAIELLGEKHWINDDVAIPLVLRNHNHNFKIEYFASLKHIAWIRDKGVVSDVNIELKRRRRILIGNLQCVFDIIFPNFEFFKLISWISLRLVAKALWAYWISFFAFGLVLIFLDQSKYVLSSLMANPVLLSAILAVVISIFIFAFRSNYIHRIFMAYISGLQINKARKALKNPKKIVWS